MNGSEIRIHPFRPHQANEASALITAVFDKFVGFEYSREGKQTFYNYTTPQAIQERYTAGNLLFVAQTESNIIGIIEIRDLSHISLLFVYKQFHRQGIARRLWETALHECTSQNPDLSAFTVNASPYSEKIYRRLGFEATADLTEKDGIKYIPMSMKLAPHGQNWCYTSCMASDWISYNQLAWTEDFLADPAEYEQGVAHFTALIRQHADPPVHTLLHFGCGAGGHDRFFKQYFAITGVDLSLGMLDLARETNPEIEYIEGDMRTIRLDRQFDAVVIPESIDYMATLEDLRQAVRTAALHLRTGGVLLVVCSTAEQFRNNNFVYSGQKGDVHVTLFENNYANPYAPQTYEITLFYLIRRQGALETYSEHIVAGLFPQASWEAVFTEAGLTVYSHGLFGSYDQYLFDDGEYTQTIFIGRKHAAQTRLHP